MKSNAVIVYKSKDVFPKEFFQEVQANIVNHFREHKDVTAIWPQSQPQPAIVLMCRHQDRRQGIAYSLRGLIDKSKGLVLFDQAPSKRHLDSLLQTLQGSLSRKFAIPKETKYVCKWPCSHDRPNWSLACGPHAIATGIQDSDGITHQCFIQKHVKIGTQSVRGDEIASNLSELVNKPFWRYPYLIKFTVTEDVPPI